MPKPPMSCDGAILLTSTQARTTSQFLDCLLHLYVELGHSELSLSAVLIRCAACPGRITANFVVQEHEWFAVVLTCGVQYATQLFCDQSDMTV